MGSGLVCLGGGGRERASERRGGSAGLSGRRFTWRRSRRLEIEGAAPSRLARAGTPLLIRGHGYASQALAGGRPPPLLASPERREGLCSSLVPRPHHGRAWDAVSA